MKQTLNLTHVKILCKALIKSLIISNGIIWWGGVSKSNISPLQIAQKKVFFRVILNNKNYHYRNISL